MKKIILPAILCLALAACGGEKKEENKAAEQPAQTKTKDTEQKDGTSINIDNNGVSVQTKDGENKTNVSIKSDTAHIEIKKPK